MKFRFCTICEKKFERTGKFQKLCFSCIEKRKKEGIEKSNNNRKNRDVSSDSSILCRNTPKINKKVNCKYLYVGRFCINRSNCLENGKRHINKKAIGRVL